MAESKKRSLEEAEGDVNVPKGNDRYSRQTADHAPYN